jgi:hypothetical protein
MATTHVHTPLRQSHRRDATRGIRWMSERQLDAYLQARETLRRLRTTTASTADAVRSAPPSVSQG